MTERDKVLKTLRDVPGVEEMIRSTRPHGAAIYFRRDGTDVYPLNSDLGLCDIVTVRENATLAEAVAALTPAVPKPPTYEFVAGLKGARPLEGYILFDVGSPLFQGEDVLQVEFDFDTDGSILSAYLCGIPLTTPTTEAEVLATLKMCRVEVGK